MSYFVLKTSGEVYHYKSGGFGPVKELWRAWILRPGQKYRAVGYHEVLLEEAIEHEIRKRESEILALQNLRDRYRNPG